MRSPHAHLLAARPILITRKSAAEAGLGVTRSWFGGAPRLGAVPWPVDEEGRALLHAAQIDLGEIAAKSPEAPLPKAGSLAFFIGGEGAVLFVPDHMDQPLSELPLHALGLHVVGTWTWKGDAQGRPIFPFHAIEFTPFDVPVAGPIPDWWQIAIHYADRLSHAVERLPDLLKENEAALAAERRMLTMGDVHKFDALRRARARENIAFYERRIAAFSAAPPAPKHLFSFFERHIGPKANKTAQAPVQSFRDFVARVTQWAEGRDPWSLMTAQDIQALDAWAEAGRAFSDFTGRYAPFTFDDIKDKAFEALPRSGPMFEAFPDSIRAVINEDRSRREQAEANAVARLTPLQKGERWHQMFGHGVTIQSAADDCWDAGEYLLLQLNSDPALHWDIGDAGAFQFWISPEELAAQNWSRVSLTSECH